MFQSQNKFRFFKKQLAFMSFLQQAMHGNFIFFLMQAQLKELIAQKDAMEKEIASLTTQLDLLDETKHFSQGLVDREGFPRNDIDFGEIANYRNLKRRKAELNNDHFALMKQIQSKLFALHTTLKPKVEQQWESETSKPQNAFVKVQKREKKEEKQEKQAHKIDYLTPFAKIGLAQEDSPAWKAGLRENDLLSEFGEINIYSLDWKKQLPSVVRESEPVRVVVMRKVEGEKENTENPIFELKDKQKYYKMTLFVVPGRWKGRGLLGCQINPL